METDYITAKNETELPKGTEKTVRTLPKGIHLHAYVYHNLYILYIKTITGVLSAIIVILSFFP